MRLASPHVLVVVALTTACSAGSKNGETDPLDVGSPGGDTSGVLDGTPSDGEPGFDVSLDSAIDDAGPIDASCATTEAAAIKPPVDVIMSIDQSGSMSDDIANVKNNVNKLSDFLKKTGLDYRVVMIGTPGTGTFNICVPPPLGVGAPSCASNPPIFRSVNQNVQSNDTLKLILSTYSSATGSATAWADFLRKDAVKVFVPITDDNAKGVLGADFDTQLLAKPGGQFGTAAKRNYVMFPIMGAPAFPAESPKCGSNAVNTGPEYIAVAKLTKGKWFPICLTDFGPVFEEIAKDIATSVACELTIPPPPKGETLDPAKVNVTYTPGTPPGAPTDVLRDDSKPCDAGANGWQYNADKTKILLCGDACTKVKADLGAKVNVQFGCETKFKPPA